MNQPKFRVGQRAEETEQLGLVKVIKYTGFKHGFHHYLVRQFAHPHRVIETDEVHLSRPTGLTHDERRSTYE